MFKIVIWGAGKNCKAVLEAIRKDKCIIIRIVDSNKELHQTRFMDKWVISDPKDIISEEIDYIVISTQYTGEIFRQCELLGIANSKIIDYWKNDRELDFIDAKVRKIFLLEKELKKCKQKLKNMPYELGLRVTPTIHSAEELLEIIINEKKSLSRFGDGELEIMQKRARPWFQETDSKLADRLKEVFNCEDRRVIIALADNFGNLECYTEQAADGIRDYLDNGVREDLLNIIDSNRIYYDAYVTRPYIMYRNKRRAVHIFELFKRIWKNRNILIIEGSKAFIGGGNDLLEDASDIKRIIAPSKNAFSVYEDILNLTKRNVEEDTLVLISLGPTATVLSYDLAMEGIQALDIGQLDNEYEWFIRNADERIEIPGKCVAELGWCHKPEDILFDDYADQIIERVGG